MSSSNPGTFGYGCDITDTPEAVLDALGMTFQEGELEMVGLLSTFVKKGGFQLQANT
jgi:hypothetical protein